MLAAATVVILIFGPFIKRAGSSGHSREANSLPALRLAPFNFVLFWFCFVLFCFVLFFVVFWPCLLRVEVPGSGTDSMAQQ